MGKRLLTQNTDRLFLRLPLKRSYFSSVRAFDIVSFTQAAFAACAALSSSAHTYRLLVVKDLFLPGPSGISCRTDRSAKRFVCSTEEMGLCSVLLAGSTFLLLRSACFNSLRPASRRLPYRIASTSGARLATGAELYQTLPNFGKRFSKNAAIPSFWSNVANVL